MDWRDQEIGVMRQRRSTGQQLTLMVLSLTPAASTLHPRARGYLILNCFNILNLNAVKLTIIIRIVFPFERDPKLCSFESR